MADYGELQDLRDWGSKLSGAIVRLAAGIHCSLHARGSLPIEIECETMDIALALAGPLISHAQAVFGMMKTPEKIEDAEKLLKWILRNGQPDFRLRDLFRTHQSRFPEMMAMTPAVELLQEHGYIRPVPKEKKLGRPSDLYEVNPDALKLDRR